MPEYISKEQKPNLEEIFLHSQLLNYYSQYSILEKTWMPIILLIDFKMWYIYIAKDTAFILLKRKGCLAKWDNMGQS